MLTVGAKEISQRLAERAEELCHRLLPGGRQYKGEWLCGSIRGEAGESLKVQLSGPHAGQWRDWASGDDHGDMLDLLRISRGYTAAEAFREAREFLGIRDAVTSYTEKAYSLPPENVTKKPDPRGKVVNYLTETRKLDAAIVNRFQIEAAPESGALVFPCYDPRGQLVNRSYRTLPKDGEKKKVWQEKGCGPCLFGWHALDDSAYRTRTILLCEGQIDAMTWTQWGVNALSIPNGSGLTWIEAEWDNLSAFDNIYLSFDSDGAGAENARKTIARLGTHRCLLVKLPGKDANECLARGAGAEDAQKWLTEAEKPSIAGLVAATDLEKRIIAEMAPKPTPFTLDYFSTKDPEGGYRPRPGDVTLWTGITGHGKSTILNEFALSYLMQNTSVFMASMEMKPEKLVVRMLRSAFAKVGAEHIPIFIKECGTFLFFADVMGYISQEKLFEMMWFAFQRYGVSQVFIDSLMRIEGLEEEYTAQGKFMNDLQSFTKATNSHVHLVAHPRKMQAGARAGKLDIKGSSLIPNNADNIINVIRNTEKDDLRKKGILSNEQDIMMHDAEVSIEKQRETGWEGLIRLKFDRFRLKFSMAN